jgi:hypothetical protein
VAAARRKLALAPALAVALSTARDALGTARVPFALAGGLAVNIWGRQRLTTDVDFAVLVASLDDLRSLVAAVQPLGFLRLDPAPLRFRRAWVGRLLLDPDRAPSTSEPVIVDLVRPVGRGAEAWLKGLFARAVTLDLLGASTRVVRPEDLVLFKLLVERDRGYDLPDAESVLAEAGDAVDTRYLVRLATTLGVRGKLRRLGV